MLTKLREEVPDEAEYIESEIANYEEYPSFIFGDYDFKQESVNSMTLEYLKNPIIIKMFLGYDDLDDFVDLMDADLKERYYDIRQGELSISKQTKTEVGIIAELINTIHLFERRVRDKENKSEVEITADLHDNISSILNYKYKIQIARKFIENFKDQYKQLMGYLNKNFRFGITLSINKNKPLQDAIEYIIQELRNIDDFRPFNIRKEMLQNDNIVISEHIVPETRKNMIVYHLILNLYDKERKQVAIKARKR